GGHAVLDEPHERADGGQPRIARPRGIASLLDEVIEEIEHERRVELLERQVRWGDAELSAHEFEEQLKAVRIGIAGVWARQSLDSQSLLQEGGDVRSDRRHDVAPSRKCSHASATLRMSLGVACRYQQVSATWVCPRYVDNARRCGPTEVVPTG